MGDEDQCGGAKRMYVKHIILGESGGMLPQRNFENLVGSGSCFIGVNHPESGGTVTISGTPSRCPAFQHFYPDFLYTALSGAGSIK